LQIQSCSRSAKSWWTFGGHTNPHFCICVVWMAENNKLSLALQWASTPCCPLQVR
jgi:hypothetical protein